MSDPKRPSTIAAEIRDKVLTAVVLDGNKLC